LEYFPIIAFHFKIQPIGFEEGAAIAKRISIGPIKPYDSADIVIDEANYWLLINVRDSHFSHKRKWGLRNLYFVQQLD
jgi:hypothetical protein